MHLGVDLCAYIYSERFPPMLEGKFDLGEVHCIRKICLGRISDFGWSTVYVIYVFARKHS